MTSAKAAGGVKAVILAAGLGRRMGPARAHMPKCMIEVGGIPIIDRMLARVDQAGITDAIVVTGHHADAIAAHLAKSDLALGRSAQLVFNEHYADWGNFYSLLVAERAIAGSSFIKFDADVVLDGGVLPALLDAQGPGVLAIDCSAKLADEEMKARVDNGRVVELNKRIAPAAAIGESIGIERIDSDLAPQVFTELHAMIDAGETDDYYERAYERLMANGVDFGYADVSQCQWCEIDNEDDLRTANRLVA